MFYVEISSTEITCGLLLLFTWTLYCLKHNYRSRQIISNDDSNKCSHSTLKFHVEMVIVRNNDVVEVIITVYADNHYGVFNV